mgnify:CR=1 FL=1
MKYFDIGSSSRVAHICEMFTEPEAPNVSVQLLIYATKFAKRFGANKLTAWLPEGHQYQDRFDDMGFLLDREINRWLLIRPNNGNESIHGVFDQVNWHLTMGDSDVF